MLLRGSVFSKTLEMETGLTVIAPTAKRDGEPCKVAYVLHGLCSNHGSWVDYTQLPLFALGYPVLFVMPDVGRSFYMDLKYGQRFFSYVVDELPAICENVFNISASREDTAIIGGSMGGFGALKCALARPEQYGSCGALASACLFLKEGFAELRQQGGIAMMKETLGEQLVRDFQAALGPDLEFDPANDLPRLARAASGGGEKPRIYAACGVEDGLLADNRRFAGEMRPLDFDFAYEELPGAHDWVFFNEGLRRALAFCFGEPEERP